MREHLLNQFFIYVLDLSDHEEYFRCKFYEVVGDTLVIKVCNLFDLALFLQIVLFKSDIELSENVWVAKDEVIYALVVCVWVFCTQLGLSTLLTKVEQTCHLICHSFTILKIGVLIKIFVRRCLSKS